MFHEGVASATGVCNSARSTSPVRVTTGEEDVETAETRIMDLGGNRPMVCEIRGEEV